MNKSKLPLIGFLQALGLIIYCLLIAMFFRLAEKFIQGPPTFINIALVLFLFVFSAAVTGSIVFGYPAYLALNQKIKEALSVFEYTILFCLVIIVIMLIVLL